VSDTLDGIRIVDLTHYVAGPYCTMLMADMGAEVIKVEGPDGDMVRRMGPPFEPDGFSPYFRSVNRNKKSVVLDLRQAEEKELLFDLVRTADAVVDNFRFGVMQKLGLTHSELKKVKPDLVTCSITAFGEDGPYRDRPAFDLILQAMSGGMSITGEPGGRPVRAGVPIGDLAGGMFAALAMCGAMIRRFRTGQGQHIDIALLDVQVSMLSYVAQYYLTDGRVPGPSGSSHSSTVPYQLFETKDGFVVSGLLAEHFWPKFCAALEMTELVERYPTNPSRVAAREELIPILEARFRQRTTAEWVDALIETKVPVGPFYRVDEVLADEQVRQRNMVVSDGEHTIIGNPIKTGVADTFSPAPRLGEHSEEILGPLRAARSGGRALAR